MKHILTGAIQSNCIRAVGFPSTKRLMIVKWIAFRFVGDVDELNGGYGVAVQVIVGEPVYSEALVRV